MLLSGTQTLYTRLIALEKNNASGSTVKTNGDDKITLVLLYIHKKQPTSPYYPVQIVVDNYKMSNP